MNVLTQSPVPSLLMLMSTGSGIFVGSPMTATSLASHSPEASGMMSQSFEVSAGAVIAQLSPSISNQRNSMRAPSRSSMAFSVIVLQAYTTNLYPYLLSSS